MNQCAGKKSFEDLQTVDNVKYTSYKETCRALGLLQDDQLWNLVMEDARQQNLPMQMRELFVMLMIFTDLMDPKALFETFSEALSEDFEHQLRSVQSPHHQLLKWMLMVDIQERLEIAVQGTVFQRIGIVTEEMQQAAANVKELYQFHHECREIRE